MEENGSKDDYVSKIDNLRELVKIQGLPGNWNYNEYMHGMYNGLELALATMEDREPIFKRIRQK